MMSTPSRIKLEELEELEELSSAALKTNWASASSIMGDRICDRDALTNNYVLDCTTAAIIRIVTHRNQAEERCPQKEVVAEGMAGVEYARCGHVDLYASY